MLKRSLIKFRPAPAYYKEVGGAGTDTVGRNAPHPTFDLHKNY